MYIRIYIHPEKKPHTSFTAIRMDGVERCMSQLQSRFTDKLPPQSPAFNKLPRLHSPYRKMQVFQRELCILTRAPQIQLPPLQCTL